VAGFTIVAVFILAISLLVSNVLSLAWMLLVQVCALAGLVLIATIFLQGFMDLQKKRRDHEDPR